MQLKFSSEAASPPPPHTTTTLLLLLLLLLLLRLRLLLLTLLLSLLLFPLALLLLLLLLLPLLFLLLLLLLLLLFLLALAQKICQPRPSLAGHCATAGTKLCNLPPPGTAPRPPPVHQGHQKGLAFAPDCKASLSRQQDLQKTITLPL